MPYLPSEARKKSELYDNVLGGDVLEYQNEIEDLKKSLNISGSVVDSKQPLRDSKGILQSFFSLIVNNKMVKELLKIVKKKVVQNKHPMKKLNFRQP